MPGKNQKQKSRPRKKKTNLDYRSHVLHNNEPYVNRLMVAVPTTGNIRVEWMMARYGQNIPPNWSFIDFMQFVDTFSPIDFMVADARNVSVREALNKDMEWLLFIDHDVILPADAFVRLNQYMREGKHPVVSGLYYTKAQPSDPLIYRGRGNSHYDKWELGDKVWVDGIPMGVTLINTKILKLMWEESPEYIAGKELVREVFETPSKVWQDPEQAGSHYQGSGTEDLQWCTRVMKEKFLERAGFPKHQKMKYPFLIDTNIFCRHITQDGRQFPMDWQEKNKYLAAKQVAREKKK